MRAMVLGDVTHEVYEGLREGGGGRLATRRLRRHHRPLPHRSLQLGLTGEAAHRYADEGVVSITDTTPLAHATTGMYGTGTWMRPGGLLPLERAYPVPGGALGYLHH